MLIRVRKAQNTMEYAILIAVVVGALSAMQVYLKRGVQSRLRSGSDKVYDAVLDNMDDAAVAKGVLGTDTQYEPYYTEGGQYNINTAANEGTETVKADQDSGERKVEGRKVSRTGRQSILGTKGAETITK